MLKILLHMSVLSISHSLLSSVPFLRLTFSPLLSSWKFSHSFMAVLFCRNYALCQGTMYFFHFVTVFSCKSTFPRLMYFSFSALSDRFAPFNSFFVQQRSAPNVGECKAFWFETLSLNMIVCTVCVGSCCLRAKCRRDKLLLTSQ